VSLIILLLMLLMLLPPLPMLVLAFPLTNCRCCIWLAHHSEGGPLPAMPVQQRRLASSRYRLDYAAGSLSSHLVEGRR